MADREYDRNRYRRMYDDEDRYGSGRAYRSGRDVDTEYSRDRYDRESYGREGYDREDYGRESGYRGMSGRGGYEGAYTREGRVGGEGYRTSYNALGMRPDREEYGRESGHNYSGNYSGNYRRDYNRNYSADTERNYGHDRGYAQTYGGSTRSFGETDDYRYGYGGEGYAATSYGDGRGYSSSPEGRRTNRGERYSEGYNYGQGYGPRAERNFDRYSGGEYNPEERSFFTRAADEVRSWFGDEEAERRRQMDERYRGAETSGYGGYSSYGMFSGRGPKNYKRSDERIQEDVNERLTRHPDIDASDIEVSVSDGVVTLSGTVDNRRAKHLAEDVAESVSGVKDVNNQIRVNRDQITQMGASSTTGTTTGLTDNQNVGATTATTDTTGTGGATGMTGSSTTGTRSRTTTT